jgi:hypothetical protein
MWSADRQLDHSAMCTCRSSHLCCRRKEVQRVMWTEMWHSVRKRCQKFINRLSLEYCKTARTTPQWFVSEESAYTSLTVCMHCGETQGEKISRTFLLSFRKCNSRYGLFKVWILFVYFQNFEYNSTKTQLIRPSSSCHADQKSLVTNRHYSPPCGCSTLWRLSLLEVIGTLRVWNCHSSGDL